jgi:hypothetical protein
MIHSHVAVHEGMLLPSNMLIDWMVRGILGQRVSRQIDAGRHHLWDFRAYARASMYFTSLRVVWYY